MKFIRIIRRSCRSRSRRSCRSWSWSWGRSSGRPLDRCAWGWCHMKTTIGHKGRDWGRLSQRILVDVTASSRLLDATITPDLGWVSRGRLMGWFLRGWRVFYDGCFLGHRVAFQLACLDAGAKRKCQDSVQLTNRTFGIRGLDGIATATAPSKCNCLQLPHRTSISQIGPDILGLILTHSRNLAKWIAIIGMEGGWAKRFFKILRFLETIFF